MKRATKTRKTIWEERNKIYEFLWTVSYSAIFIVGVLYLSKFITEVFIGRTETSLIMEDLLLPILFGLTWLTWKRNFFAPLIIGIGFFAGTIYSLYIFPNKITFAFVFETIFISIYFITSYYLYKTRNQKIAVRISGRKI